MYLLKGEWKKERGREREREERAILDGRRRETNYHTTFLCSALRRPACPSVCPRGLIVPARAGGSREAGHARAGKSHFDSRGGERRGLSTFPLKRGFSPANFPPSRFAFCAEAVIFIVRSTFRGTKIMRTYGRYLKDLFIASYSFPPRSFVRATTKYTIHKMDGGGTARRTAIALIKPQPTPKTSHQRCPSPPRPLVPLSPPCLSLPPSPHLLEKVSKSGPTELRPSRVI